MDIQLNFLEKGQGEVLILLHGNGEDVSYFEHQIEYFSQFYRVIAIDTRGHGSSPRGTKPFTIVQFAEDLHGFMVLHNIKKAHILGFSDGGNIALTFAVKYPHMVDRLILNGANLYPDGVKFNVQIPIVAEYYRAKIAAPFSKKLHKKAELYGLMVHQPQFEPAKLRALHIKTLVIAGREDMIRESHTRMISRCLPNAQLAIIEGDHFIANKMPDKFNSAVHSFLVK
ncbi:MAG: alpha/beta hydrolase [Oscillospiraceae bacterium]|nr:alpha/beta hydrolase [Oscillospiraceae bacterium]